jgi:hypothetical protein
MNEITIKLTPEELEALKLIAPEMEAYSYEGAILQGLINQILNK